MSKKYLLLSFVLLSGALLAALSLGADTGSGKAKASAAAIVPPAAPFALRVRQIESDIAFLSYLVAPSAPIEIEVAAGGPGPYRAVAAAGRLETLGPAAWRWSAPASPGHHLLTVERAPTGEKRELRFFVVTPYDGSEALEGYRIGAYPQKPLRGLPAYRRPEGLIAVTAADLELAVSPHFKLGQFLCKQPPGARAGGAVRFVTLRTELLVALEKLLAATRAAGIPAETLTVMSGYRTPHYNAAIGNDTTFSRHIYGDAADVFVDRDGDGRMDDLNRDGRIDTGDARVLFELAEGLARDQIAAGGLGLYGANASHGPFLHLDTRGYAARWGI